MATLETTLLESIQHLLANHSHLAPQVEAVAARVQGKHNHIAVGATPAGALAAFFDTIKPVRGQHALIRVGGAGDGGYLVPDDFSGVTACFSPGVAATANFELEMASRGIESFMADYSVDESPVQHPMLHFEKKYLGTVNNAVYVTLDDWVQSNAGPTGDLVLQMDIEGAEYGVLLDCERSTLARFRMVVVEFHYLDNLIHTKGFELIQLAFNKLLKDFAVVHIHPNNYAKPLNYLGYEIPATMEFTFQRKDRLRIQGHATAFPHALDHANVPGAEDFALPPCWHA